MKWLAILIALLILAGCDSNSTKELTYQELVNYPASCDRAESQLAELKALQERKNFDPDPDNLDDADRAYNSRLKATIWWFSYRCDKS